MLKNIWIYFSENWVEWIFMIITGLLGLGYKKVIRHQQEESNKNNALCIGVQALLRDRIIQSYNEYSEKGYCPIYAKDNIKRLYQPYSELGVDDVITELVSKLLQMPTEKR